MSIDSQKSSCRLSFDQRVIRMAAREAVADAVRSGRMNREPCERCGDVDSEGHHDDYSKPLKVRWLCRAHHREVHREIGKPMGRRSRVGAPTRLVGVRASDAERSRWEAAAKYAGTDLSAWLRQAAEELTVASKERRRGWMQLASPADATALGT